MRRVRLGQTDLQESKNTIHRALDLDINLFDTAQGYGFGAAERLLGGALRERTRREDVIIATITADRQGRRAAA